MPWHPPCALSNLIVTNLSSCQRIDFSIFDCFFLLRPTAKLFAFLRSCVLLNTFATGFFTRCFFHLAVQFSKYILRPSRFARWLPARIFQILCAFRFAFAHPSFRFLSIPENDTGSRRRTVISTTLRFASWIFRLFGFQHFRAPQTHLRVFVSTWNESPSFLFDSLPRKEVIQPHLPIRLPCYDFTPVIGLTFDGWLLSVTSPASGAPNSHGVTGGVYKARERIHRGMLIRDY